jgi:signal transduction histidine kinase
LRILPGHLDEIAIFRTDRPVEPPALVGDTHPPVDPRHRTLVHSVVFEGATAPFEVLLRVRSQSNHSVDVEALRWDDSFEASVREHGLVVAHVVFTLLVLAWATVAWRSRRDAVLGLFVAHQATMLLLALTLLGAARLYGPAWLAPALDRITSLTVPVTTGLSARSHARLLADLGGDTWATRALSALATLPAMGFALVAIGQVRAGLFLTNATVPPILVLACAAAWLARAAMAAPDTPSNTRRGTFVVAVYVATLALTMPPSMRVLGLASAGRWTFGAFFASGVTSTLLLGSLLVYRERERRARHARDVRRFEQAQREAEVHRARVTEQSELLTMLTHELKTPLSVVSLALGSAGRQATTRERAQRAVQSMSEVIDRCAQTARFDDALSRHDERPDLTHVAIDEALRRAADGIEHGDRIEIECDPGLPPCLTDAPMLLVILGNLLENAIKYGPAEAKVGARVERAIVDGHAGIRVGITNALGHAGRPDPEHVFEKYHRGARARHGSGSGLGLYLAHRLAYRLGGTLTLRAAERDDDDVTFDLWLPT